LPIDNIIIPSLYYNKYECTIDQELQRRGGLASGQPENAAASGGLTSWPPSEK